MPGATSSGTRYVPSPHEVRTLGVCGRKVPQLLTSILDQSADTVIVTVPAPPATRRERWSYTLQRMPASDVT